MLKKATKEVLMESLQAKMQDKFIQMFQPEILEAQQRQAAKKRVTLLDDLADELVVEESSQLSDKNSNSMSALENYDGEPSYAHANHEFDSIIDSIFDKHSLHLHRSSMASSVASQPSSRELARRAFIEMRED